MRSRNFIVRRSQSRTPEQDRIAVNAGQPLGGADAASLGQSRDGHNLLLVAETILIFFTASWVFHELVENDFLWRVSRIPDPRYDARPP